mmetsp:Transcript_10298/g.31035  ORF Transcript_10298/g.31035 Transcript_10298/m.31035 type:complete len:340 (+) Transcript_10298:225-1244(+)
MQLRRVSVPAPELAAARHVGLHHRGGQLLKEVQQLVAHVLHRPLDHEARHVQEVLEGQLPVVREHDRHAVREEGLVEAQGPCGLPLRHEAELGVAHDPVHVRDAQVLSDEDLPFQVELAYGSAHVHSACCGVRPARGVGAAQEDGQVLALGQGPRLRGEREDLVPVKVARNRNVLPSVKTRLRDVRKVVEQPRLRREEDRLGDLPAPGAEDVGGHARAEGEDVVAPTSVAEVRQSPDHPRVQLVDGRIGEEAPLEHADAVRGHEEEVRLLGVLRQVAGGEQPLVYVDLHAPLPLATEGRALRELPHFRNLLVVDEDTGIPGWGRQCSPSPPEQCPAECD